MRRVLALLAVAGALGLVSAVVNDAAAQSAGGLDLSIRARSLGVVPEPTEEAATLGLETMRAPTGAGTTRWPSRTAEVARGVYVGIEPLCLPGEDGLFPRYPGARRR